MKQYYTFGDSESYTFSSCAKKKFNMSYSVQPQPCT